MTTPGSVGRDLLMAQSGYRKVRSYLREKNKERQGNKTPAHLCFSYCWTMEIDRCGHPLNSRHVITSLSQNGNCLLSTAWSDNGQLHVMGTYCEHWPDPER